MVLKLDKEILLGSATAPYQIEGGALNTDWHRWCKTPGKIKDKTTGEVACDHWNQVSEDVELLSNMNHQIYRFGIEWARIQPAAGAFDDDVLEHYRQELKLLVDKGIKPLVTLHHFVNPDWLVDMGGWERKDIADRFARYVRYVVDGLADLVDEWVTINEPFVYVVQGYAWGIWPPGKHEALLGFKVLRNMIHAHVEAYKVIHQIYSDRGREVRVGIAHHMRNFDPYTVGNPFDLLAARLANRINNNVTFEGTLNGKLIFPIGFGHPWGDGPFCDFLGVNFYTRDLVKFCFNPAGMFMKFITNPDNTHNDLGWEIYPHGLFRLLKSLGRFNMPIYVTENGIADSDDDQRPNFILRHLAMLQKARNEGVNIERYYHWSTMDNFEWAEGLNSRFGLVEVDYDTLERKIRPSGAMFAEICKTHIISDEMLQKYAPELLNTSGK